MIWLTVGLTTIGYALLGEFLRELRWHRLRREAEARLDAYLAESYKRASMTPSEIDELHRQRR